MTTSGLTDFSNDCVGPLLGNVANHGEAFSAREKLERALSLPLQSLAALGADASGLNAGASIGIALCPTEGHDMQTLLKRADQDMYERKQARSASWPDQAR